MRRHVEEWKISHKKKLEGEGEGDGAPKFENCGRKKLDSNSGMY